MYLLCISTSQSIIEGSQGKNPIKKWIRSHGGMLLTGVCTALWLATIFYIGYDQLTTDGAAQSELNPPLSLASKTIFHKHTHKPIWSRQLFTWGSLLPDDIGCVKLTISPNQDGSSIACQIFPHTPSQTFSSYISTLPTDCSLPPCIL